MSYVRVQGAASCTPGRTRLLAAFKRLHETRVEAEKPTLDTRSFMTGPGLNATPAELLPSAVYLISYLNEAKRRPRIPHLRRSPISSTILSTLTMAYEE